MYVISSFIFTNYESQFNFVVQNIYFVFKIYKPSRFIFDPPFYKPTLFTDKTSDPTLI